MKLTAAVLVIAMVFAIPVIAKADDASDIRAVISSQLDAFRSDDGAAAYSFAAPGIKALFGNKERFMTMVRQGYPPVYRATNVIFGPLTREKRGWRQEVSMTGPKGGSWVATYTLERQPDGSMKITGCRLRKNDDIAV